VDLTNANPELTDNDRAWIHQQIDRIPLRQRTPQRIKERLAEISPAYPLTVTLADDTAIVHDPDHPDREGIFKPPKTRQPKIKKETPDGAVRRRRSRLRDRGRASRHAR
jgi:hypothetical protein